MAGAGDAAVAWIAERQHALVTRGQAAVCGLGKAAVAGRCERGLWRRLHPGVYLVGPQAPVPKATVFASVASCAPFAAAGGEAAAWLYAARDRCPAVIEVVMLDGRNPGARDGVRIRRPQPPPAEVRWRSGIPLTLPQDTLLDLAGTLDPDELETVWALMVRNRAVSDRALREAIRGARQRAGIGKLRAIGTAALTRSPLERELLRLVRLAELPTPETNVQLGAKEVDLWWPAQRLVVEVDAFGTHGSSEAFERDRWTDTEFDMAGIAVRRFTRRQIQKRPYAVIARLSAALAVRA